MSESRLDILLTKYLDARIDAAELEELLNEVAGNPDSRMRFESAKGLHGQMKAAFGCSFVTDRAAAERIFDSAMDSVGGDKFHRVPRAGWFGFASGIAAGLLIAFGASYYLVNRPDVEMTAKPPVAKAGSDQENITDPVTQRPKKRLQVDRLPGRNKNQGYYYFVDDQGNQWLLEGYRDNRVVPASFH